MPKGGHDGACTTWADVSDALPAWEAEYGVEVEYRVRFDSRLPTGAYVECVVYDGQGVERGAELLRQRHPFPARKATGAAGAVLYCTFAALQALENTPWSWSTRMRKRATE